MTLARHALPRIPVPLGGHLEKIRIERGLSLADVTRRLKFSERQLKALEDDDYAALPGAPTVRGMVRGYAKLLMIDPEPLLAELQLRLMPVHEPIQPRVGSEPLSARFWRTTSFR